MRATAQRAIVARLASLWTEHSSPRRLGAAVAVGIFVGCTPLYGLQTMLGLLLALLLRLNKPAVVLGTQISIPPLAPLLAAASIQLGALLLAGTPLHIEGSLLTWQRLPLLLGSFGACWALGGALLGAALGAVGYFVTVHLVRRQRGAPR
jgi:uncharacterized protein (DUF2062 family)